MKKAFIEQMLYGFIIFMGIVTFVATSVDETNVRNKAYDLKTIATNMQNTMAKYYEDQMDMCNGIKIAENILKESALGQELFQLKEAGDITFDYGYYDLTSDGEPDAVRVNIQGYKQDTFWYKFLDQDSFTLGARPDDKTIDTPKNVTISYGAYPNAWYQNIMGTYELDANNCITNLQMYMTNSKWSEYNYGDVVADGIQSPPTYVFAIANGNRKFDDLVPQKNNPQSIEVVGDHCFNSSTYPEIKIGDQTVQATIGNNDSGNVFFEHMELNADGIEHFHIIPIEIIDKYKNFKNNRTLVNTYIDANASGTEKDKFEAFKRYCDDLNADNDPSNDINYENSPTDQYHYALEDLEAGDSDFDYTDLLLNSKRVIIPNTADEYKVEDDGKISFINDYCSQDDNIPPVLKLTGCPVNMDEDTITNSITWTASDEDGTIETKTISANYGNAILNEDGTIIYTPYSNYYGSDVITVVVKDNDDATTKKECNITIEEINDNPVINGTPQTDAQPNTEYIFKFSYDDVDGDLVTIDIDLPEPWLSFQIDTYAKTGVIKGTPPDTGAFASYDISINASDGRGGTDTLAYTLKVSTNTFPTTIQIPDQEVMEGTTFNFDASNYFTIPNNLNLKFFISGNLPRGMQIDPNTGVITANIADATAGEVYTITVGAKSSTIIIRQKFKLSIIESDKYTIIHDFNNNGELHDWENWENENPWWKSVTLSSKSYNGNRKLKVLTEKTKRERGATQTFKIGPEFANKDAFVEFDFYYSSNWEKNKSYFVVYIENEQKLKKYFSNNKNDPDKYIGPNKYKLNSKVNSSGELTITFGMNITAAAAGSEQTMLLDNIKISVNK